MVHATSLFADALATKLFPFFLAILLFVLFSAWSPYSDDGIWENPTNAIIGLFFSFLALAFIYEMFFALPDTEGEPGGIFGAVLLSALALMTGAVSVGFWFELITVDQLTGEFNFFVSILLILAMGVYLFGAREAIFHSRRVHEAFKRS